MSSTVPSAAFADPAWASVPSSYVVCADDRAVRPEAQRERAALVGTSVELDTDHSPFFSDAAALADFIADRHRAMAALVSELWPPLRAARADRAPAGGRGSPTPG